VCDVCFIELVLWFVGGDFVVCYWVEEIEYESVGVIVEFVYFIG